MAIENAVSAAGALLLTEVTMTDVPEPSRTRRPSPRRDRIEARP
jgi:hypothetical protein